MMNTATTNSSMRRSCGILLCLVAAASAAAASVAASASAVDPNSNDNSKDYMYSSLTTTTSNNNNQQLSVSLQLQAGLPHYWIRQVEAPGVVQISNLTLIAAAPNLLKNSEMNVLLVPLSHSCLFATSIGTSISTSSQSTLCEDWTDLGLAAKSTTTSTTTSTYTSVKKEEKEEALIWCCTASLQKQGVCPQGEGYRYTATSTLILNRTKFEGQWSHLPKLTTTTTTSSSRSDSSTATTSDSSQTKGYRVKFDIQQSGYYALLMVDCNDNDNNNDNYDDDNDSYNIYIIDDMQEQDIPDSFNNRTIHATAKMQFQSVHGLLAPPLYPFLHFFTGLVVLYSVGVAASVARVVVWTTLLQPPPQAYHDTQPNNLQFIQKFIVGIFICGLCANALQTILLYDSNSAFYIVPKQQQQQQQQAAAMVFVSILRALQRLAIAYILLDICSYRPCRDHSHGCHFPKRQTGRTCCIWMLHSVHLVGVAMASSSLAALSSANHTHHNAAVMIVANALASTSMIIYAGWILWELYQTLLGFVHQQAANNVMLPDATKQADSHSIASIATIATTTTASNHDDDNQHDYENTINTSPLLITPLTIRSPASSSRSLPQPQSQSSIELRQLYWQYFQLSTVLVGSLMVWGLLYWKSWVITAQLSPSKYQNSFQREDEDQYVFAIRNERHRLQGQAMEQILSWILLVSISVIFVWQWECHHEGIAHYCCSRTAADTAPGCGRDNNSRDFHCGLGFTLVGSTGGESNDSDSEQEEYNNPLGDSSYGDDFGAEIELIPCCTRKGQQSQ